MNGLAYPEALDRLERMSRRYDIDGRLETLNHLNPVLEDSQNRLDDSTTRRDSTQFTDSTHRNNAKRITSHT
eukprot:scaffold235821_cov46-Attheya_sp.AAC.1